MLLTTTALRRRQRLRTRLCRPKSECQPLSCTAEPPCHRVRPLLPTVFPGPSIPRRAKQPRGSSSGLVGVWLGPPIVTVALGPPAQRAPRHVPLSRGCGAACCIPWAGTSGWLGLCVLPAGGSLSCCIDPHRGRNMCAMHRSMGRLKMCVRLPDDWGKLCRWHRQHSEGHADLRRSPRGEARPLVKLMGGCLITCPPGTPASQPGTHFPSGATSPGGGRGGAWCWACSGGRELVFPPPLCHWAGSQRVA